VQEVVTSLGEEAGVQGSYLRVRVEGHGFLVSGALATEPLAGIEGVQELSAANLQAGLEESGEYGVGDVVVEEVSRGAGGGVLGAGEKRFLVTTVGGLADQTVAPVQVFGEVGGARAGVVSEGRGDGYVFVAASNVGDAGADSAGSPVVLKDRLPAGLTAVGYEALSGGSGTGVTTGGGSHGRVECELVTPGEANTVTCRFEGEYEGAAKVLPPYGQIEVRIAVVVGGGAHTGEVNEASVVGGGAFSGVSVSRPITVSGGVVPFGIEDYEVTPELEGGVVDRQAGSHPFQETFTVDLNQGEEFTGLTGEPEAEAAGLIKNFRASLPPGMLGNPTPFARCGLPEFQRRECPEASMVGMAVVRVNEPTEVGLKTLTTPVYNLEPSAGEPARLGFLPTKETPAFIDTSVRNGGDYGVSTETSNIVEVAGDLRAQVTLWGTPGDPRHDSAREGAGGELGNPPAFLVLPASCSGYPLVSFAEADSWEHPGEWAKVSTNDFAVMPAMVGCDRVPFEPSVSVVSPTPVVRASQPLGLDVDVHVPQEGLLDGKSLVQAAPRDISVTLPEGVVLNPAAGDGLQACSEALVGYQGRREFDPVSEPGFQGLAFSGSFPEPLEPGVNACATAAKIGVATIKTPLLSKPLVGGVYIASQEANPFGSLLAMYIVAEEPVEGVLVKLAGQVHLSASGQITTVFEDNPQTPFEDAELRFFGEERAALTAPAHCGTYTTTSSFVPWSAEPADEAAVTAHPSSSALTVSQAADGGACPAGSLPFAPQATGGVAGVQAGGFTPFSMSISREPGSQYLQAVRVTTPPGLSGILTGVELCSEANANAGECGPGSLIGEATVSVGAGSSPLTVGGGKVYLTGPYAGAPFGLSITSPAKAGPYDLADTKANHPPCDCVVVRASVSVSPSTAALTVATNPSGPYAIPQSLENIPLQIQHVNVTINRPGFMFNPTDCSKGALSISTDVFGSEGASSLGSIPLQPVNCANLKFAPKVAVSAGGHASKHDGASLAFKISYPKGSLGSEAWFAQTKFDIPKQLPSRLETIQQACRSTTFETDRAACPKHSIIGSAIVHTQVLPVPLEGPVYFVSYGSEKFPDVVLVLKGYGVTIELQGNTFIDHKTGVTSATFRSLPDVPFETVEVSLPTGEYSEFGSNLPHESYDFCGRKLTMPTMFTAANGAEIHQNTPITITGCKTKKKKPKAKKTSHTKPATSQKGGHR
jgi:hypothetical protein